MLSVLPEQSLIVGKRCLVLDDEFLIALDIQQILETAGAARVICVSNAIDAVKQLERETFNAAVIDLMIDGEACIEVAHMLERQRIPFVVLTGMPAHDSRVRQFSRAPLVAKPYDTRRLLAALNQALQQHR